MASLDWPWLDGHRPCIGVLWLGLEPCRKCSDLCYSWHGSAQGLLPPCRGGRSIVNSELLGRLHAEWLCSDYSPVVGVQRTLPQWNALQCLLLSYALLWYTYLPTRAERVTKGTVPS